MSMTTMGRHWGSYGGGLTLEGDVQLLFRKRLLL